MTEKYSDLLVEINTSKFRDSIIERCFNLISGFSKSELDWAITATIWAWNKRSDQILYQFLEAIFKRGADPNVSVDTIGAPPIFYATFHKDPNLIEFLVKWGADIIKRWTIKKQVKNNTVYYNFSPLEYVVYNSIWRDKPLPKKVIKSLIKAGSPTELHKLAETRITYPYGKPANVFNEAVWIIKTVQMKQKYKEKIAQLESERAELKNYIVELECRPAELGGPEYEAGLKRWEARQN